VVVPVPDAPVPLGGVPVVLGGRADDRDRARGQRAAGGVV